MRINHKITPAALAILCFGVFFVPGRCAFAAARAQIDNFDATIRMNADSSIDVEERIGYDVGGDAAFWFYRYIPVRYIVPELGKEKYALRLSEVAVTDKDGNPYEFVVSESGSSQEIKIGSKGVALTGKKSYVIRYHLAYPVRHGEAYDEFFWNVTGDNWPVPISKVEARVIYPEGIKTGGDDSHIKCYAGRPGSREACDRAEYILPDSSQQVASGTVLSASDLAAGEGMTFVVAVPKGLMQKPTYLSYARGMVEDTLASLAAESWVFVFPLLILIRMLLIWIRRGRDPKGRETIIPEYEVPDNLTPAELGIIMEERCGQREIIAEMIGLADKGYLSITKEESGDYIFKKLKDPKGLENSFDYRLIDGIFRGSDTASLSHLRGNFAKTYRKIVDDLFESVYKKGYFYENPRKVIGRYSAWAFLILFVLMFGLSTLGDMEDAGLESPFSPRTIFFLVSSLILSMVIITAFANKMPKKTPKGALIEERIRGFREYLRTVEKERLQFHNAPGRNQQDFEDLLPYAIALGVEDGWVDEFDGMCEAAPSSHGKK
jgi:hypothetical protein